MIRFINKKAALVGIFSAVVLSGSCTFSVSPVWNANKNNAPKVESTPSKVSSRDDLKPVAIAQVTLLHRLIDERKFEEVYEMIDDKSPLKLPKDAALNNIKEIADELGKFESMELTRDSVVEDASLNGGQLQVRQEFIVKFAKDTPSPKRPELFNWNVYPDGTFKLWSYMNSKGDD